MGQSLLTAAKYVGKLAADCVSYLGRTGLDLVDGGRKLWLRRQSGERLGGVAEIDRKLESIRAGQQTRWSDFHSLPGARKRLIRVVVGSTALLALYLSLPPSSSPREAPDPADTSSRSSAREGPQKVDVWEGDIHAEKRFDGADGVAAWTANYHVRLKENCYGVENSTYCSLDPLELRYEVEANEVLDQRHFGVYSRASGDPPVPHYRSVLGKASGVLRLGPDDFNFDLNAKGGIYKDQKAPTPATTGPSGASEAERYWRSCLAGVPEVTGQPAYRIEIGLGHGYGAEDIRANSDRSPERLNPLLVGIVRSGPDLQEGHGNLKARSAYSGPVLDFWLCGKLKSPDDDEMRGEHAFSSTSNFIDELYDSPTQVVIRWKLKRKREELEAPEDDPTEAGQGGLLPADLALTIESAPDLAAPNEKISYRFAIENKGPGDTQDVMFSLSLADAELIGVETSQGECSTVGGVALCRLGELEEDDTAGVTLRLMPRQTGTLIHTANVASASPDPDLSNNQQNVTVSIQPRE